MFFVDVWKWIYLFFSFYSNACSNAHLNRPSAYAAVAPGVYLTINFNSLANMSIDTPLVDKNLKMLF